LHLVARVLHDARNHTVLDEVQDAAAAHATVGGRRWWPRAWRRTACILAVRRRPRPWPPGSTCAARKPSWRRRLTHDDPSRRRRGHPRCGGDSRDRDISRDVGGSYRYQRQPAPCDRRTSSPECGSALRRDPRCAETFVRGVVRLASLRCTGIYIRGPHPWCCSPRRPASPVARSVAWRRPGAHPGPPTGALGFPCVAMAHDRDLSEASHRGCGHSGRVVQQPGR
jgi:hypothetical protein